MYQPSRLELFHTVEPEHGMCMYCCFFVCSEKLSSLRQMQISKVYHLEEPIHEFTISRLTKLLIVMEFIFFFPLWMWVLWYVYLVHLCLNRTIGLHANRVKNLCWFLYKNFLTNFYKITLKKRVEPTQNSSNKNTNEDSYLNHI